MTPFATRWRESLSSGLRTFLGVHGHRILLVVVLYMAVAAIGRLVYAFPYLVGDPTDWAAIDLKYRHAEVVRWFAGLPFYGVVENGDYPPASYAILWPLLGWLPLTPARWLWACTTSLALAGLAYRLIRDSEAEGILQRAFMGGLALSVYPVQMTIFVGQLGIHVVALLLIGLAYLHQSRGRWWEDLVATALLLPALVKPTLAAPFFWIVCFVPVRVRPMLLIGGGYVALTVLAASFQGEGLMTLMKDWLGQRTEVEVFEGHANLHHWLASLGLDGWMLPASLVSLALLGAWTYYHRQADFFVLLGVAALVARLWTHHRLHDDLLLLAPMVALFRIATTAPRARDVDLIACGLLALTWVSLHVPTWVFYDLPEPLVTAVETFQALLWVLVLVFLLAQARADPARRNPVLLAEAHTSDA